MRIIFYLLTVLSFNTLFAQIPNANFENWNSVSVDKLSSWMTQGKVTKVSGGQLGSFAAKLETDIAQGGASVTLTTGFTNGYPYFNKVDTVKVWVKYVVANADSASFQIAQFNSDTNLVRAGEFIINSGTATTWTEISIPLTPFDTSYSPQTMYIYAENTLGFDPQITSYLIIDNIRCYYKGVLQGNLPNHSFENWTTQTVDNLAGWTTTNEIFSQFGLDSVNCEKTTLAQSGAFAVKLHTVEIFGTFIPGGIVTGINQVDAIQTPEAYPTFPVNQRYKSLSGFLKFTKMGSDSGEASVYMFNNGNLVGEGHFLAATTIGSYTQFEAKITYDAIFTGIPDSATIIFLTASDPGNATGKSVMWIDNIKLNTNSLGLSNSRNSNHKIFPNPFQNSLNIEITTEKSMAVLYSLQGKAVITQAMNPGQNIMNTTDLTPGFYILKITDGEKITSIKLIKE